MKKIRKGKYYIFYDGAHQQDTILFDSDGMSISVTKNDIDTILTHLDDENLRDSKRKSYSKKSKSEALSSLTINVSDGCNLACRYCYANAGTYNKKFHIMNFSEFVNMFESLLELYPKGIGGYVFFGGEPMLGFSSIKKFVEFVCTESIKRNLVRPKFSIVTNGTMIDLDAWRFFEKYNFSVTISLDGDKEVNDRMRIFKNKTKSVFDVVKNNLMVLERHSFLLSAEATLNKEFFINYKEGGIYHYAQVFFDLHFDTFVPFMEKAKINVCDMSNTKLISGIKTFYTDLVKYSFELLVKSNKCGIIPSSILSNIISIVKKKPKGICSAGHSTLFYAHTGDIYPCQMYYSSDKKLGSIFQNEELCRNVACYKQTCIDDIQACKKCIANKFCQSWCPGTSYLFYGNERNIYKLDCISQQTITENIIYNIVQIYKGSQRTKRQFIKTLAFLSSKYAKYTNPY